MNDRAVATDTKDVSSETKPELTEADVNMFLEKHHEYLHSHPVWTLCNRDERTWKLYWNGNTTGKLEEDMRFCLNGAAPVIESLQDMIHQLKTALFSKKEPG